jgi:hypothetical protein
MTNCRIQVLEASTGTFVAQMGKPELDLRTTYGVAVDDTCLYVAERDFHRVTVGRLTMQIVSPCLCLRFFIHR